MIFIDNCEIPLDYRNSINWELEFDLFQSPHKLSLPPLIDKESMHGHNVEEPPTHC